MIKKINGFDLDLFDASQLSMLCDGIERGVDVAKYANPIFDCAQMREIRRGLMANLNVAKYAKSELDSGQMCLIRTILLEDISEVLLSETKLAQIIEVFKRENGDSAE